MPLGSVARQWRPVWSCVPEPKTVASFWATWKSIVQGRSAAVSVLRAASSVAAVVPVEVLGQDPVLGGVFAERVEQRVGHVGLEADGLGLADPLEQVDHRPPGVHPAPADLALGGQPLAVIAGDRRGLLEGLGDLLLVALGVLGPVGRRAGRVDPDDAVRPDAQLAELLGDPARLADRGQVVLALAGRRPSPRRRTRPARRPSRPRSPWSAILPATALRSSSLMSMLMCGS